MPFTFSHPALVIPLLRARRRYPWLSATGLIIGSIAPDFEKFFRLQLASSYSHTAASIFYFSCPVALVVAFVFHGLVRRPLLAHSPEWLRRRVAEYASFNWPRYFRQHYGGVLLSIVLGAAGHILWDSFTHPSYLMMKFMPGLTEPVQIGRWQMPVYEVSGLVSTGVGGLLTAWAVWQLPQQPVRAVPGAMPEAYWGVAALLAAALVIQWVLLTDPRWLSIGIAAISASMIGVLVSSVYFRHKGSLPNPPR